MSEVKLRPVKTSDLDALYAQQLDPDANWMAAFTVEDPTDRNAFITRWGRMLANHTIVARAIDVDGRLAGSVVKYDHEGRGEVSYWLGREWWGRGIATQALAKFLDQVWTERPVWARVAADNVGSIRVLEKCGFEAVAEERGFANARAMDVSELVMRLG